MKRVSWDGQWTAHTAEDGDLPQLVCALFPHITILVCTQQETKRVALYCMAADIEMATRESEQLIPHSFFLYRNYNITTRVVLAFTLFSSPPLCNVSGLITHKVDRGRENKTTLALDTN